MDPIELDVDLIATVTGTSVECSVSVLCKRCTTFPETIDGLATLVTSDLEHPIVSGFAFWGAPEGPDFADRSFALTVNAEHPELASGTFTVSPPAGQEVPVGVLVTVEHASGVRQQIRKMLKERVSLAV